MASDVQAEHPRAVTASRRNSVRVSLTNDEGNDWSPDPSSHSSEEEDYDNLHPNPATVVDGAKGGGFEPNVNLPTLDQPPPYEAVHHTKSPSGSRSIQVTLEKTDKRGRYILTADDPQIREILRNGIEREAQAASGKQKKNFRELVFTRQFTRFDRQNPTGSESPFHGFFTLFWLCLAMLLLRVASLNWRNYGSVFGGAELLQMMFDREAVVMGLLDGIMTIGTVFCLVLQKLVVKGYLTWDGSGWIIQNIWQTFYLGASIGFTFYRHWPWTHTIFIVLHAFVYLMKQHSYAFYNGHLSRVYRRKRLLEQKLKQLEQMESITSPVSPDRGSNVLSSAFEPSSASGLSRRRHSLGPKDSTNLKREKSEISTIAAAIESGEPLDDEQLHAFSSIMRSEIGFLDAELAGKCSQGNTSNYPNNLTLSNFADWTVLPTLVYELEYPRQERINWWYVAEKTAATFGTIWVMMVISQAYIYPAVHATVIMKEDGMTLQERWKQFPWILSDMLFPLLLEQLLAWYVIWECVLNVLAEITRFADRGFYGDWWNSVSWDQYARDWNRPVHNFLLRHVYHSSISAFHLSKGSATFVTFLLSALVHECVMFCLFKKVRGYLFALQLSQIPLAALSRTKLLKGRTVLGNLMFWIGLFVGPSLLTSLYLIV